MSGNLLREYETTPKPWASTIWEIMVPKRAHYLSALYRLLGDAVHKYPIVESEFDLQPLCLDGYSIYEVDGAYRGGHGHVYEERILVIRLILPRSPNFPGLRTLGRKFLEVTRFKEEEVWIVEQQGSFVHSFTPVLARGSDTDAHRHS